jgi:hypothetical protein
MPVTGCSSKNTQVTGLAPRVYSYNFRDQIRFGSAAVLGCLKLDLVCSLEHFRRDESARLQDLLDELESSRASRKRPWDNLQEIRWVLKDTTGVELPAPARKTIDIEGRIVKDGVKKALRDRQLALAELVHAIREHRKIADSKPLTLQGSDYPHAVHELNKAIDRAEAFLQ